MAFLALGIFSRAYSGEELSKYLLAYTACQWAITSCFQWQKNVYVKTYNDVSEKSSLLVLFVSIAVFLPVFIFVTIDYGFFYSLSLAMVCIATGLSYYLGIAVRLRGGYKLYLIGDSVSMLLRWGGAIVLCMLFFSIERFYLFIFLLSIPLLYLYVKWLTSNISNSDCVDSFYNKVSLSDFKSIFYFAGFFVLIDFASSGLNYVDRFYVSESVRENYLVNAAIGTQLSSIFFGALISTLMPRLKSIDISLAKNLYLSSEKKLLCLVLFIAVFSFFLGPLIVSFVATSDGDPYLLLLFSISQFLHFYITLSFVFSLHFYNRIRIAIVYLFGFLIYWIFLNFIDPENIRFILYLKITLLSIICLYSRVSFWSKVSD
ncbi:MATE family efflux transporter [Rheinheimera gaetbuli]